MTAFHSVSLTLMNVSQTRRRGSLEAGSCYGERREDKSSLDEAALLFSLPPAAPTQRTRVHRASALCWHADERVAGSKRRN